MDNNRQHVKSFNVDQRGKNRFKFASSKQREKKVSADVYRSYKRQYGVTTAADREEQVHRPKKHKIDDVKPLTDDDAVETFESTFAEELDLANERNGSSIFAEFYREMWPLVRSIPELIHHSSLVIDILLSYLISPESSPDEKSYISATKELNQDTIFVVNLATTDVLHLLAVLAKDLQSLIHPFVFTQILPRIITDLINPPPPPIDSGRQPIPLDVTILESAFRTLSYILKHDAESFHKENNTDGEGACLESLRKFYGPTLGHKREVVRRLAAETFAPVVRRLKSDEVRKQHLRRVLRALTISKSTTTQSQALKRAKEDAIDGVASFLFEIARGVTGHLHSKGPMILRCVLDYILGLGKDLSDSMHILTSIFLKKTFRHLSVGNGSGLDVVINEIQRFVRRLLSKAQQENPSDLDSSLACAISLSRDIMTFRNGFIFACDDDLTTIDQTKKRFEILTCVVDSLTNIERIENSSASTASLSLNLFFTLWNYVASANLDSSFFQLRLELLLKKAMDKSSCPFPSTLIIERYLDDCSEMRATKIGFPLIAASVANFGQSEPETAKRMIFRLVSRFHLQGTLSEGEEDNLFPMINGQTDLACDEKTCQQLLNICLSETLEVDSEDTDLVIAKLNHCSRCIPFLCSLNRCTDSYEKERKALKWIIKNLKVLMASHDPRESSKSLVASTALIECFSRVSSLMESHNLPWLKKMLETCASTAWKLVLSKPTSLWTTKSMASLCGILQFYKLPICEDSNEAFDLLVSNLRMESHFLRLYTLKILNSFPRRPYVINHSELDLSDDLDEEKSFAVSSESLQSGLSGSCDLIGTLLKIESIPVGVESERGISSLLTRAEAIGRSGKLPVLYAEALANHMLGIFHIKFASLWVSSSRVLRGLSESHHAVLCEATCCALRSVLYPDTTIKGDITAQSFDLDAEAYQSLCLAWDRSGGRDISLFSRRVDLFSEKGSVSPFLSTDRESVFQEIMKLIESAPEITAKYSRQIVPMFFDFLKFQYYCFHDNDPDLRELTIPFEELYERTWTKTDLNQRTLQSRLLSFLKAFASVKGSDQLYQRSFLSSIFQVHLSHQDPIVASTSLTCLLNFRIPHIDGYADKLLNLLKQGALRESLLDWNISKEGEVIDPNHRPALIPLLQRILFGRLSSSSVRGTKTKDSPQSRRKAIISCLSQLEGDELFPTFYLMIRNYIPKSFQIQPERMHVIEYREEIISLINHTKSLCLRDFPIQRHEGFLNLLSSVISQIGHGLSQYVPPFMSILVSIMNSPSSELDMVYRNVSEDKELMNGCTVGTAHRSRSLKTLAYRCAGVLMDKFASSVDFSLQMESLWNGISDAVLSLPDVVSKSNSCPLILQLLLVLSSHPCYICFLSLHQEIVKSVVMCIGPSTEDKALDKALEFVLNLLHFAETDNAASRDCSNLISNHVMLLLHQFQLRFCGISEEGSHERKFNKGAKTGSTFPKELQVLRLVSQAMKEGRINPSDAEIEDSQTEVYNTLTSLLVGFISNLRIHSDELVNLMRIVSALLDKVDSATAVSHFFSLSKILSYETWNRLPPLARQEMLATMRTVSKCNTDYATLDLVTITLQDIFATNSRRVDEVDYDRVLPVLSCLQDPTSPRYWNSYLCQDALSDNSLKYLSPIIYSCLTLLQQNDLVLSRSANKALRSLIFTSCQETSHQGSHSSSAWSKLIESCVIPGARSALRNSNEQIKRHGLTLIADISKAYAGNESVNLHGDLHILACEDNPDLDFFMNALHVQFHRRGRAMQRLRTKLNDIEKSNEFLSVTSITAVLLPLVTHPIYEYDSKLDEVLAQECIVTVGALVRQLSWSKYHTILWTALNQVDRHPNQERLIIAMICSILDACHFDLLEKDTSEYRETAVWRALEKRIIPKVEQLMTNEKKGSSGKSIKLLRPNIFLALVKLMKKFPSHYFEKRFPRLLAIICDALKNRESNVRELARKALAATVIEVGPLHLSEIFRSLALSLTEGYQLHVRSATLHQILFQLSKEMNQSSDVSSRLEFDKCIPAMMDFIFQDIFGVASDRRDSDGSRKQLVKEASGSKYLDSVEMICQLLTFKPSEKINLNLEQSRSSIHDVVNPFFEKLKQESIPPKFVQKIKECLTRVVTGLSHNQSARFEEVLELSYATIYPLMEYSNAQAPLFHDVKKISDNDHSVIVWQPSTLSGPQNIKDAQLNKITDQAKLITVLDGSQAPKLTGTSRLEQREHGMWNSQAIGCATEFALNLLWTAVKSQSLPFGAEFISRLKPFLSLLTKCVDQSRETSVIAMSIRCLALILKKGVLPSREVLLPLSTKIIHILSEGEASVGTNEEMMQSCLSALVALIKAAGAKQHLPAQMKKEKLRKSVLSMSEEQMIVLVSFLRESLLSCNDSNASIELVNLLVQQRFASPEFYDLMEQILDLSVRSHKESFRSQCCNIFSLFLIEYPLSKTRFEQHLRQVLLNLKYEHKEGRVSAIRLVSLLIDRFPIGLLDEQVQIIFLPLVLQLVNDDAEICRELVSQSLLNLIRRVSKNCALALYDYAIRWHKDSNKSLIQASLQLFGIFAQGRKDFPSQTECILSMFGCLQSSLESRIEDWEQHYYALKSFEKVWRLYSLKISEENDIWDLIMLELSHPHLWVKLISSRIIRDQLKEYDPQTFLEEEVSCPQFLRKNTSLYRLASSFCSQLDQEEANISSELSDLAIASLSWLVRAMYHNPQLCYAAGESEGKEPVKWLLTRLSTIAKWKGTSRRKSIFKCFAAFCHSAGSQMIRPYLELIIEPLFRSTIEAAGDKDNLGSERFSEESNLAQEVLSLLEESCEHDYVVALSNVKLKFRQKHEQRKSKIATERVSMPEVAAKRKMVKQSIEKERRKRRVDDYRKERGATIKKSRY